jgi:hypothetical protein
VKREAEEDGLGGGNAVQESPSDGPMKLDKTEIARRQLGTALALFLQDCDPVSVHALACAGCEIAEHLTRKAGEEPFSTHALLTFPDLDIGKIRRLKNQYWNAFKHAQMRDGIEREDSELLERFGDEVNDHTLYIGWHDYMLAVDLLVPTKCRSHDSPENRSQTAYAARLGVQVPMNAPCRYTLGLGYASLFPRSVCTG